MRTKLTAARLATKAGVPVFICSSREEHSILGAVAGTAQGTYFKAPVHNMKTRLQWMAFYAQSMGNLYVDEGAADALQKYEKSLLPRGIAAMEGDFQKGDVVSVFRRGSHEYLGKGIVNYSDRSCRRSSVRKRTRRKRSTVTTGSERKISNGSTLLNRYMQNPFKIAFGDGFCTPESRSYGLCSMCADLD